MMHDNRWRAGHLLVLGLLALYALLIILPLVWMVLSGFKDNQGLFLNTWGLPEKFLWENYATAWRGGVGRYFLNSIIVTGTSVVLLLFVLGGLMLSPQVSLIPLFRLLQRLKLYNTYWALIIPYVAYRIPFTTFLIRSYMLSLPREIEDSAYIDGCSAWTVFYRIILPMSKPILVTAALFTAMSCWNEFMFALVFIESDSLRTIPIGLMGLKSSLRTEWTILMAGLTLSALPMVALFLIFQKQFIRGITSGGVKG